MIDHSLHSLMAGSTSNITLVITLQFFISITFFSDIWSGKNGTKCQLLMKTGVVYSSDCNIDQAMAICEGSIVRCMKSFYFVMVMSSNLLIR